MDFSKKKYNILKAAKNRQINVADHIYSNAAAVLDATLTGVETTLGEEGFEILAKTKQATDMGRSLLGQALCMTTGAVGMGAKVVFEQEAVQEVCHDVARISDDLWETTLNRFIKDEETKQSIIVHKEAAEWIVFLLAKKLPASDLTFKFFFDRKKLLLPVLGMMFRTHTYMHQERTELETQPLKFQPSQYEEWHRQALFAFDVYQAVKDPKTSKKCMQMSENDQVLFVGNKNLPLEGSQVCPKFIIFTDSRSKSIVIALRGTASINDVVIDIVCVETDFLGGKAHRGMAIAAIKILDEIKPQLQLALETYPGYKLFLTGHSLGGGVAILMTMAIRHGEIQDFIPKNVPMVCKVFAAPPVFYSERDESDLLTKDIEAYVQGSDCVPRFSLANTVEILAMICAVDALDISCRNTIEILKWREKHGQPNETILQDFAQIHQAMEKACQAERLKEYCKLQPVGQLFYVSRSKTAEAKMFKADKTFIMRFLFMDNMILDHKGNAYREAFESMNNSQVVAKALSGGPRLARVARFSRI